ncbi:MAG: hypothetical protein IT184_16005 [Acidobacteria bacterium]|nr:hypothetical protein [Acidobacteriota bacterium]
MSAKDKLEIGLKPDAPYRPDNLPEHQHSPEESKARARAPRADDDKTQKVRQEAWDRQRQHEVEDANEPDEKLPDQ